MRCWRGVLRPGVGWWLWENQEGAVADPQGGLQPPYGMQPPLEQGEIEEEKVKGEEEEEEEGFSPPMAVTWIRHCSCYESIFSLLSVLLHERWNSR